VFEFGELRFAYLYLAVLLDLRNTLCFEIYTRRAMSALPRVDFAKYLYSLGYQMYSYGDTCWEE